MKPAPFWISLDLMGLAWLHKRYVSLLEELKASSSPSWEGVLELLELNQSIQASMFLGLLASQLEFQGDVDRVLSELGDYLAQVLESHIRESQNLEKLR